MVSSILTMRATSLGLVALTRGWQTDLAVLEHTGSLIDDRFDHIIVHSPENSTFHWGNYVLVTDPQAADDSARWVEVFRIEFPGAEHVSIGLPRMPSPGSWGGTGLVVDTDDVLFSEVLPQPRPLADGYLSRTFESDADWEALVRLDVADNARTGAQEPAGYESFLRDQGRARRRMVTAGVARWFGVFDAGGTLTASLGIVLCHELGRFQSVSTDAEHRRRGLAGHLVGLAARWAAGHGATAWVIVTESTNPAGRLYRSLGFQPDAVQVAVSHQ